MPKVDEHGFLTDPEDWTQEFAEQIAQEENLSLGLQSFYLGKFTSVNLGNLCLANRRKERINRQKWGVE